MKTVFYHRQLPDMEPSVATVGFFDGVHRGHQFLVSQVKEEANIRGLSSTVVTFDRHPRQVLKRDFQPQMLGTLEEKLALLAQTGVDNCVVMPFNEETAALSARTFMRDVLLERLQVRVLVTGYDNRFGHDRTAGFNDYVRYGRDMGMDVMRGEALVIEDVPVSSSVIRSFLQEGEVAMASRCLGYPYTIKGSVVGGEQIGTSIGFPTANIVPVDDGKVVPAPGVYAVWVKLGGAGGRKMGMMNIGTRPTFDGKTTTLEVHILDFGDNLYGETIGVSFVECLRKERKFRTPSELVARLHRDMEETRAVLTRMP